MVGEYVGRSGGELRFCRHFCPSSHQKSVIEFGEWLCEDVLKSVPHRQWVFSIPKRLRIYFMLDRSLLAGLSQCAWKVVSLYLKKAVPYEDAMPGAVIAVQSFGDFQNFHPHLYPVEFLFRSPIPQGE